MNDNTKSKKTVMVIEDDELLLDAVERKLKYSDFNTIGLTRAKQALEYLGVEANAKPDLIWLDYMLPDMDGLEFMEAFNRGFGQLRIPVIVVSNSASEEKVDLMRERGVKRYLLKAQYRLEDLVGVINEVLTEKEVESK